MRQIMSRTLTAFVLAASLSTPLRADEAIDSGAYLAARIAETDAMGSLKDDGRNGRFDSIEQSGDERRLAGYEVNPREGDQDEQRWQNKKRTRYDATHGAVHEPADISRQLLRLGARQEHAIVQRVQKASFGNPAPFFDQLLMHDRNLPGGTAEAY